jgi:ubiquinone/menaquinone biosynthesis C-methylase UbiE
MKGKTPTIAFRVLAHVAMPIRNMFHPTRKVFAEIDIQPGHRVLDYGCGPGHFTIMAAQQAGPTGRIHALDIHPLALKLVARKAKQKNLDRIDVILSDCRTSLPHGCLDRIMCLDVYHLLENQSEVLAELHRVLKPDGRLYFSDHHMHDDQIVSQLTSNGYFRFQSRGCKTLCFGRG